MLIAVCSGRNELLHNHRNIQKGYEFVNHSHMAIWVIYCNTSRYLLIPWIVSSYSSQRITSNGNVILPRLSVCFDMLMTILATLSRLEKMVPLLLLLSLLLPLLLLLTIRDHFLAWSLLEIKCFCIMLLRKTKSYVDNCTRSRCVVYDNILENSLWQFLNYRHTSYWKRCARRTSLHWKRCLVSLPVGKPVQMMRILTSAKQTNEMSEMRTFRM